MDNLDVPIQSKEDLEKVKLLHEIQKIKVETEQNKKKWWKQASYLNLLAIIISPTFALVLSYYLVGKDYLDITKVKNEYDKERIQDELKLLTEKRDSTSLKYDSLQSNFKDLSIKKDSLISNNKLLVTKNNSLLSENASLQNLNLKIKSEYKIETQKIKEDFKNEIQLIPIRMILESIANVTDELRVNTDDKTYELLIHKLQLEKNNKLVSEYIESFLDDNSINAKSKTEAIIANYFATNNNEWKIRLHTYVKEDIINRYSNKLHWKSFSSQELHENNKLAIHSILGIKTIDKDKQVKLNDILSDIIVPKDNRNSKTMMLDTLLTPSNDYSSFIDFIKAYRSINIDFNELPKRSNLISDNISRWVLPFTVFVGISIQQELEKKNDRDYLRKLNSFNLGINRSFNPRMTWGKMIARDYSNNTKAWIDWLENNNELVTRLNEPNLETYRKTPELLIADFK